MDHREELRRRLYQRDAEAHDVAAYLETTEAVGTIELPSSGSSTRGRRLSPLRRGVLLSAPLLALAMLAALLVSTEPGPADVAPAVRREPITVAVPPEDRAEFEEGMRTTGRADLLSWLVSSSGLAPGSVGAASVATSVQRSGSGSGVVPLDAFPARATDGHLTVIVVTDRAARLVWSARTRTEAVVDVQGGVQEPGLPTVGALTYAASDRPVELRVWATTSARWTLLAVFTT